MPWTFDILNVTECVTLNIISNKLILTYQVIFLVSVPCILVRPWLVDVISEDFSSWTMVTVTSWVTSTSCVVRLVSHAAHACPYHGLYHAGYGLARSWIGHDRFQTVDGYPCRLLYKTTLLMKYTFLRSP